MAGGVLVSCAPGRGCGAPGAQWAAGGCFPGRALFHVGAFRGSEAVSCGMAGVPVRGAAGLARELQETGGAPALAAAQPPRAELWLQGKEFSVPAAWGQGAAGMQGFPQLQGAATALFLCFLINVFFSEGGFVA